MNKLVISSAEHSKDNVGIIGLSCINTAVATLCNIGFLVYLTGSFSVFKSIKKNQIVRLLPVAAILILSKTLTYYAYRYIPLSLSQTVKGLLPVFSALLGFVWLGTVPSARVRMALFVTFLGVFIASGTDLSFNAVGFIAVVTSTFFASFQSVWLKEKVFGSDEHSDLTLREEPIVHTTVAHMLTALEATIFGVLVLVLELLKRVRLQNEDDDALAYYFAMPPAKILFVSVLKWVGSISSYIFLSCTSNYLSHSIAKIGQRLLLIVFSVAIFRNPISLFSGIGSGISILGICMYANAVAISKKDKNRGSILPVSSKGPDGPKHYLQSQLRWSNVKG